MSLKRKAMKTVGYAVAPKLSMLVNHPAAAVMAKAAGRAGSTALERMMAERRRPRRSAMSTAARGLGAAAVAAPLGWWLGRRLMERPGMGRAAG